MNILKVKTLICFQNQKEQWNVTNLAVTLGEEKYAVSRVLTVLEKEGLIDKSNRRKPILTKKGKMAAEAYSQKVELVIGHLLSTGVSQEVAREDAVTIASYCKEETLEALKKEEIAYYLLHQANRRMTERGSADDIRMEIIRFRLPFFRRSCIGSMKPQCGMSGLKILVF